MSIDDEIRRAIAAHIQARRQDADFQTRLQASIERNKEILEPDRNKRCAFVSSS